VLKPLGNGESQLVTIASLFDGSHFGELVMLTTKSKSKQTEQTKQNPELKENETQDSQIDKPEGELTVFRHCNLFRNSSKSNHQRSPSPRSRKEKISLYSMCRRN